MEKAPTTIPKGLKCLIVDDHDLIRKSISKVLKKLDFSEIIECHNGKDARSLLENQPFDLIICDLDINFISGFELLDHVRTMDTCSDTPFIIVTGSAGKDDIVKAANKGAEDYLVKPFQAEELESKIVKVISQYQSPGPVLGRLHLAEKKIQAADYDAANVLLQEVLKLKDVPRGRHLEAVILMKQGLIKDALHKLQENIRLSPSYLQNYITLSNVFIEAKDYPNAIRALIQELDIHPKQPLRQIKLANMLLKEGSIETAIEHYRLALLENNKNPEALYGMGTAYALAENLDKAIYYFKRYRRHHPKDGRPLKAIVQFSKKIKKGRLAELALLDEKKAHPDRMDTYTILADFYLSAGLDEQACATLEAAIKRKPDHAAAYIMMAQMLMQQGKAKEAIAVCRSYCEASKDPNGLIMLARLYLELAKPSLAISELHKGMEAKADPIRLYPVLLQATYMTKQLGKTYFVRERLKQLSPGTQLADAFDTLEALITERRRQLLLDQAS